MDMSNATASGPSYGLFDVLFGTAPKGDGQGDGKEFGGSLMDIIKALNKGKEELSQGISRTDMGTVSATGQGESLTKKVADKDAMAAELGQQQIDAETRDRQLRERMAVLFAIGSVQSPLQVNQAPMAVKQPPAEQGLPQLDPVEVNRTLQAKNLPTLSSAEQLLLDKVNAKLEKANGEQDAIPDLLLAKIGKTSEPGSTMNNATAAPMPAETIPESALVKELSAKGIDSREIKSGEAQGAAPEKFLNTETYLKMHETFGKAPAKEPVKKDLTAGAKGPAAIAQENLAKTAVAEPEGKGGQANRDSLGGANQPEVDKLAQGHGAKGKSGVFAAELMQSLKGESTAGTKDVFLPGTKPEQMRPTLIHEVQQSVNVQAVKGGGEMRLVVHPPELGEVHLKVGTKEGKVEVAVTTQNQQVADLIQGGSKELENSLQDKNLSLAKFEVSVSDQMNVATSDNKSNLTDQFLSQNQNSFSQHGMNHDGSSSRQASDFGQDHQGSRFGMMMDEMGHGGASTRQARTSSARTAPSRSSAGRLDVVA